MQKLVFIFGKLTLLFSFMDESLYFLKDFFELNTIIAQKWNNHNIKTFFLFRPYWRCYYSNTDAIIYVVDSMDRDRIGISKTELFAMLEVDAIQLQLEIEIVFIFFSK